MKLPKIKPLQKMTKSELKNWVEYAQTEMEEWGAMLLDLIKELESRSKIKYKKMKDFKFKYGKPLSNLTKVI